MNIARLLTDRARTMGEHPAIIDDSRGTSRTISFREFERTAALVEKSLAGAGLQPGDPVLVLQPPSIDLCLVLVALLRGAMPVVFIDPGAGLAHLAAGCRATRPRAMIGCRRAHWLRFVCPELRRIPLRLLTGDLVRSAAPPASGEAELPPPREVPSSAAAIVRFTSGTTGEPKPVVRTHSFLHQQVAALEAHLDLGPGQSDLVTMPMFLLSNLATGVASIIPSVDVRAPGRIDAAGFARQITRRAPTRLAASPALLQRLVDHARPGKLLFPSLQRIDTGGAPVLPGLLDDLAEIAPNAAIHAVYGSTEAEPIAVLRREDIAETDRAATATGAGLLAGTPAAGLAVRLIRDNTEPQASRLTDEAFDQLLSPPGEPGEIVVSGPHVHPGLENSPAIEPTKIFTDSTVWHRTGDSGRWDAHGRLWLLGRTSARITDQRGSLHPLTIEAAVRTSPGVRQAAVIACEGRRLLAIEADPAASPPAPPEWIHAHVDDIRFIRRIPLDRRHNAKVDYVKLLKHL